MSRKKLRKALKDPNTVHQVRLSDGRVVEWTGNDDSPLREALAASPGRGGPSRTKKQQDRLLVGLQRHGVAIEHGLQRGLRLGFELGHPAAVAALADATHLGVQDAHGPRRDASTEVDKGEAAREVPGHPLRPDVLSAVGGASAEHAFPGHAAEGYGPVAVAASCWPTEPYHAGHAAPPKPNRSPTGDPSRRGAEGR